MSLRSTTTCFGYQQIATLTSAQSLTVPTVSPMGFKAQPTLAVIVAETQGVRWRDDGTAPTASVGMPLAAGVPLNYDGDLTKIQFIEQTSAAKLNVSYYA